MFNLTYYRLVNKYRYAKCRAANSGGRKLNKREKQREETYADIVRIGEELFATKGYEHTSIQQIADACGMTKGALYHHFESKEALLEQICQNHYQYLLKAAQPYIERNDIHWFKRIGLMLEAIRQANESKKSLAGEYLKARKDAGSGQFGQRLADYDKQFYITIIAPVLEEARNNKEASFAGSSQMLSVFIYYLDKAMTDEISTLLAKRSPEEFEKKIQDILETFVHSLSALLGIEKEMVLELVKIPETINFFRQLL